MTVGALVGLLGLTVPVTAAAQAPAIVLRPPDAVTQQTFSRVRSIRELRDGSLLVADGLEGLLHVEWNSAASRMVGRRGSGPGEYTGIGLLHPLPGDSTLFIDTYHSRWNILVGARIVTTVAEHEPLNRFFFQQLSGADGSGHVLAVPRRERSPRSYCPDSLTLVMGSRTSQRWDTVVRIKGPGTIGQQVRPPDRAGGPGMIYVTSPLASEDQALLFLDGWIALAKSDPYRVDWRLPDGSWRRGRALPFVPVRVTQREKCFAVARLTQRSVCDELPGWPDVVPAFATFVIPLLRATPEGHVVIARTPTADAPGHRYDVVNRTGQLIGLLALSPNETLIGFGARSAYVVETDDDGVQTVRRHPWP